FVMELMCLQRVNLDLSPILALRQGRCVFLRNQCFQFVGQDYYAPILLVQFAPSSKKVYLLEISTISLLQ
ncbi:hypothetical protein TNCV_1920801, partial [Trichonephila clavipes]